MRRRNMNIPKLATLTIIITACIGGLIVYGLDAAQQPVADEHGCYNGFDQKQTAVFVDVSEPRFNEIQARSLRRPADFEIASAVLRKNGERVAML